MKVLGSVGWFLVALIAYLTGGNWRYILIATSVPMFAMFGLLFFLPESPKWLLATGKLKEAEELVRNAVIVNGKPPLNEDWKLKPLEKEEEKKFKTSDDFGSF